MAEMKRITLHPLKPNGSIDESVNLYPKTLVNGVVDQNGEAVEIALKEDVPTNYVTTDTPQDIHAKKTHYNEIKVTEEHNPGTAVSLKHPYGFHGQLSFTGDGHYSTNVNLQSQGLNGTDTNTYTIELPAKNGTVALTSDIGDKEDVSNKVTSLSDQSTDVEYPSAKCIYDYLQEIRAIIKDKRNSLMIDTDYSINYIKQELALGSSGAIRSAYLWTENGLINITQDVLNTSMYDDVCNPSFDSTLDSVMIYGTKYMVFQEGNNPAVVFVSTADLQIQRGDQFVIAKRGVPDRWAYVYPNMIYFYAMEGKVDLSNYYTKAQTYSSTQIDALIATIPTTYVRSAQVVANRLNITPSAGEGFSFLEYHPIRSYTSGLQISTTNDAQNYSDGALFVPEAGSSQAGVVTTGEQTFAGLKNFSGGITAASMTAHSWSYTESSYVHSISFNSGNIYLQAGSTTSGTIRLGTNVTGMKTIDFPNDNGTIALTKNAAPALQYDTSAPSSANTNGLKIVVLSSEPATRYDGYIYIITGSN